MKTLPFLKKQEAFDFFPNDLNIRFQSFPFAQNLDNQYDKFCCCHAVIVQRTLIKIAKKPKNACITNEVENLVNKKKIF